MRKILPIFLFFFVGQASAQEDALRLTLSQAIGMAQAHSPEAEAARHTYRASYWNYRFHQANYLPSVTLTSSPSFILNTRTAWVASSCGKLWSLAISGA